jgi:hypothetical protein
MRLVCDDVTITYYYVDDETDALMSPHFDYEADAVQWKYNIENKVYEELQNKMREVK